VQSLPGTAELPDPLMLACHPEPELSSAEKEESYSAANKLHIIKMVLHFLN
jgi:hypothetical protein